MIVIGIVIVAFVGILWDFNIEVTGLEWNWDDTISVAWKWVVYATPDVVNLSLSVNSEEDTTTLAQQNVNESLQELIAILSDNWIESQNIQTTDVYIRQNYTYDPITGISENDGFQAGQTLSVKIPWVDEDLEIVPSIIDEVSVIEGIEIYWLTYDIDDKAPYYSEARELAMEKAEQKAEELAGIVWVGNIKVSSISEYSSDNYYTYSNYKTANVESLDMGAWAGGGISLWQVEVTVNVDVVYDMK